MTNASADRAEATTEQPDRSLAIGPLLIALLAVGLLLRVLLAAVIVPGSGFGVDVHDFAVWARDLAARGPGGFYREGYFVDYPPGYLYVLWALGMVETTVGPLIGRPDLMADLVKWPGVLGDIGVAGMVFLIGRRYLGEMAGLAGAAVYVLNPGVILDSAVWGQIDSVGTLVLLASLYTLARGWTEASAALAVLATLVKFQYGFVVPIVLAVGLKRHLWGRSSDEAFDGRRDVLRVITSLAAGIGTLLVLMFPFGLALFAPGDPVHSLWDRFLDAASTYTGVTINAFNLWMNPWSDLAAPLAQNPMGTVQWGDDRVPLFTLGSFAVTPQLVGTLLFLAVAAIALAAVRRRDDAPAVLFIALVLAVAFFALPTRVHERYLFPALALAAPFVVRGWAWRAAYGVLSLSFFFNIYYAYTVDYFENPPPLRDPVLAVTALSPAGVYLLSFAVVGVLAALAVVALAPAALPWGRVARSRASVSTAVPTTEAEAPPTGEPEPRRELETVTHPPVPGTASTPLVRARDDEPSGFSLWALLRSLRPSLRRDPSDPFYGERAGRLRLGDGVLLALIVLIALVFRLFRLETPVAIHFDEVYHARSATEWIANWRYGANRDAYEWTHPMLAKYLIAGGIVLADPNRVVGGHELAEPATQLAVAPARSLVGRERSILFAAEGDALVVRDSESYAELGTWGLPDEPSELIYDEASERVLVAYPTRGEITVFAVGPLLRDPGNFSVTAPPTSVETDLPGLLELEVLPGGSQVAARATAMIAVVDLDAAAVLRTVRLQATGIDHLAQDDSSSAAILATQSHGRLPATGGGTEGTEGTEGARGPVLRFLDAATLDDLVVEKENGSAECPSGHREVSDGAPECVRMPIALPAPAVGPTLVHGGGSDQRVFIPLVDAAGDGWLSVVRSSENRVEATVPLPAAPLDIVLNDAANLIYVTGPEEVWAVQPHGDERSGFVVFDDTDLPGRPLDIAVDATRNSPSDDNQRLIVSTEASAGAPDGDPGAGLVSIDTGSNAFAWRLAGAIFGAILAGLIFLLGATMFRRRRIAVLAGLFVAFDSLSFAQSRISMNDVFVGVFIVAAYLLFWQIWSGRWARSAWWALPVVGVLIGLAAASKWVGFYALAGLLVLVLARSDLGRLVLLAGFAFALVVAGIGAPWPFFAVLLGAVVLLVALAWVRPIRIDAADLRALPATGIVLGGVGFAFALAAGELTRPDPVGVVVQLLARGAEAVWPAAVMLGAAAVLLGVRAYRSIRDPEGDAGWYLPSGLGGFSWPWAGACLVVVPLVVYALTYVPYLAMGHDWTASGGPADGYRWSLEELQNQMFGYHFGLKAGHPASSPWWSWPLSLRPVWFYQGNFDGETSAVIYNGGNFVLFALGVPALIYASIQAWRRQSLALVLVLVAFAFQWLPWTRIERATFLYHYFTAMPFIFLALAYLADDALRHRLWRGVAMGLGVAAFVVWLLLYPIASGLTMPNWYTQFFQILPPWNFGMQYPDPPQSDRALVTTGLGHVAIGAAVAVLAVVAAMFGKDLLRRLRSPDAPSGPTQPVPESG